MMECYMNSDVPTAKTYLGFVLTWIVLLFLVWLLLVALFGAGRWLAGTVVIVTTIAGFAWHSIRIGRRARQAIRCHGGQPR
jgi:hypothetical protein